MRSTRCRLSRSLNLLNRRSSNSLDSSAKRNEPDGHAQDPHHQRGRPARSHGHRVHDRGAFRGCCLRSVQRHRRPRLDRACKAAGAGMKKYMVIALVPADEKEQVRLSDNSWHVTTEFETDSTREQFNLVAFEMFERWPLVSQS